MNISKYFAEVVTSDYNQHVSIMTVGKTGEGKSSANLRLAYDIAVHIAEVKGGSWEDYFSLDHVAVITKDEIFKAMSHIKPYGVYLLDDIGVGWSARDWNKEGNKLMNNVLQTFRTDNTVLLLTLPSTFLIDKVPRTLMHYYIEMQPGEFKHGYGIGKLFRLKVNHRDGNIFRIYLREKNGDIIKRVLFKLPPDEIRLPYEDKRKAIGEQLRKESMDKFKEIMEKLENEGTEKERKPSKSETFTVPVLELRSEGYSMHKIAKMLSLSSATVNKIIKQNPISYG